MDELSPAPGKPSRQGTGFGRYRGWRIATGLFLPWRIFRLPLPIYLFREQEKLVEEELEKRGLRRLDYADEARRSCVLDNGYAGSHQPSFVVHYATADLQDPS